MNGYSQIPKKSLILLTALLVFCAFLAPPSQADIIDAPHNNTNNIKCTDCHAYSLWWQFSPEDRDSAAFALHADAVCAQCHGSGGPQVTKIAHAWTSMEVIHNPLTFEWTTKCVDCHDPHFQGQLGWLGTASPYLITGTLTQTSTAISFDTIDNTSTFSYEAANAPAGSSWLDPALWSMKTDTPLGLDNRGLVVVINSASPENTYEINNAIGTVITAGSADGSGTITVQGQIDTTSFGSGNISFAIIYGQLIKQSIMTPNSGTRLVKFFDPQTIESPTTEGGFIDLDGGLTPQGICQVCHTLTDYWLQDGTVINPDSSRFSSVPTDHNSGAACTVCHDTRQGFKPLNADHTFISSTGTSCANCHSDQEDVIQATHNSICSHCHTSPPALLAAVSTGTSGKWPSIPHNNGTCLDCHDSDGPGLNDIAGNFTNHPKALDHTGQVNPTYCTSCHFHKNKDLITEIHDPNLTGTPCIRCHNLTWDAANTRYTGTGELIDPATSMYVFNMGAGDCTNCHSNYFYLHDNIDDHSTQVVSTPQCVDTCHITDNNTTDPLLWDSVDDTHVGKCGICHDTGNGGVLQGLADTKGPGDCVHCHIDFYVHPKAKNPHTTTVQMVDASAPRDCGTCHLDPDLISGIHGTIADPTGCTTCHDSLGILIGSAIGKTGGGDCLTCHDGTDGVDRTNPNEHPSLDHTGMNTFVTATPTGNCVSCHTNDPATPGTPLDIIDYTHNGNCWLCHASLKLGETNILVGSAQGHDGHLQNTCTDCHNTFNSALVDHQNEMDHSNQVTSTNTGCADCHNGDPAFDAHSYNCGFCHDSNNDARLQASATNLGIGKIIVGGGNNCLACHTSGFNLHDTPTIPLDHGVEVTAMTPQSCTVSTCHDQVSTLGAGIYVGTNSVHTSNIFTGTNSCAACHATDGTLNPPAIPLGGDCKTCHTSTVYDGYPHL